MHLNHSKLVELLADAAGMDVEKVESQLEELTTEIAQAISEDEAYEIEGFGIFSSIGNRVMFIPSKELETEINFKYAGMEPIEIDVDEVEPEDEVIEEPDASFDDPFEGIGIKEDDVPGKRDPYSGLVVDLDEDEIPAKPTAEEETESEDPDDVLFGGDDTTGKEIDLDEHEDIDFDSLSEGTLEDELGSALGEIDDAEEEEKWG